MKRSIFLTAGFPSKEATIALLPLLQKHGIDFIEVGIPFSDPVADGPVIQKSSLSAIKNGTTVSEVFNMVQQTRTAGVTIPLYLMGYFNPVLQFGLERFLERCKECDVQGVVLPDLTPEEYVRSYQSLFERYTVSPIFLITPVTTDERIRFIASVSKIFIYAVSGMSITGGTASVSSQRDEYLSRLKNLSLPVPVIVGFGLKTRADIEDVSRFVDGGIIGSAFIEAIDRPDYLKSAEAFLQSV